MFDEGRDAWVTQRILSPESANPTLLFGPVSATLRELFDKGYHLRAICYNIGRRTQHSEKLHLVRDNERWLVGKVPRSWFEDTKGLLLSDFIKNNQQMFNKVSADIRDPFEQLTLAYPKRKKSVMMGNQTLKEFVRAL